MCFMVLLEVDFGSKCLHFTVAMDHACMLVTFRLLVVLWSSYLAGTETDCESAGFLVVDKFFLYSS